MPLARVYQRRVTFELSRALSPQVPAVEQLEPLQALVEALYRIDLEWYAATPDAPSVLSGVVEYVPDPRGVERWLDAGQLLERGRGDCKSIAAAVAAEWTLAGRRAMPLVVPVGDELPDFHVVVVTLDDGAKYDPCVPLGMPTEAA